MPRTRDKIIAAARKREPQDHLGRPLASIGELVAAQAEAEQKSKKKEKEKEEKDASK